MYVNRLEQNLRNGFNKPTFVVFLHAYLRTHSVGVHKLSAFVVSAILETQVGCKRTIFVYHRESMFPNCLHESYTKYIDILRVQSGMESQMNYMYCSFRLVFDNTTCTYTPPSLHLPSFNKLVYNTVSNDKTIYVRTYIHTRAHEMLLAEMICYQISPSTTKNIRKSNNRCMPPAHAHAHVQCDGGVCCVGFKRHPTHTRSRENEPIYSLVARAK